MFTQLVSENHYQFTIVTNLYWIHINLFSLWANIANYMFTLLVSENDYQYHLLM